VNADIAPAEEELRTLEAAQAELAGREAALEARLAAAAQQAAAEKRAARVAEKGAERARKAADALRPEKLKLEARLAAAGALVDETARAAADNEEEAAARAKALKEAERGVQRQQEKIAELEARQRAQAEGEMALSPAQRAEFTEARDAAQRSTMRARAEQESLEQAQTADAQELRRADAEAATMTSSRAQKAAEQAALEERLAAVSAASERAEEKAKERGAQLAAWNAAHRDGAVLYNEVSERLAGIVATIDSARDMRQESEKEQRARVAVEEMRRKFGAQRVRGRLQDLCSVRQRADEVPVTRLVGRHLSAVVVDTEATAGEAMAFLREQRHRPMLFIPLARADGGGDAVRLRPRAELEHFRAVLEAASGGGGGGARARYKLAYDALAFEPDVEVTCPLNQRRSPSPAQANHARSPQSRAGRQPRSLSSEPGGAATTLALLRAGRGGGVRAPRAERAARRTIGD
jgi:structural maintenance of chromosome 1